MASDVWREVRNWRPSTLRHGLIRLLAHDRPVVMNVEVVGSISAKNAGALVDRLTLHAPPWGLSMSGKTALVRDSFFDGGDSCAIRAEASDGE